MLMRGRLIQLLSDRRPACAVVRPADLSSNKHAWVQSFVWGNNYR